MIYKYDLIDAFITATCDYFGDMECDLTRSIKKDGILQLLSRLPLEVLEKIVPINEKITIDELRDNMCFHYTFELDTEKKMFNIAEYYSDLVPVEEVVYNKKDFV